MKVISDIKISRKITVEFSEEELNTIVEAMSPMTDEQFDRTQVKGRLYAPLYSTYARLDDIRK